MGSLKSRREVKTRRAKGSGAHFWSPALQLYVGRVTVGGRRFERRAKTVAALNDKLAAVRPPGPTTTVKELSARWLGDLAVRDSTKDDYADTVARFIVPHLGSRRVCDLTTHDVNAAVQRWRVGANTTRKNMAHLAAFLEYARRAKLLGENPARDARRPKPKKVVVDPFTPEELLRIIHEPKAGPVVLMAAIGCRVGEALALDVADFDKASGLVGITKTYSKKHGLRAPKSENGVRTVRVPEPALAIIATSIGSRKRGPLFPAKHGGRRVHSTVQVAWRALLTRLGIRKRPKHQLRHTWASHAIAMGYGIGDVAAALGDSPATILATYCRPTGADLAEGFEKMFGRPASSRP